jgi:hypothetical protein
LGLGLLLRGEILQSPDDTDAQAKSVVVVPCAFEDVEGAVDLFGEYQSGEVVGENEFAEFDARVLLAQGVGKSVGTADGEDDFAAGLGECFF